MLKDLIEDEESSGAIHDFTSKKDHYSSSQCDHHLLFADYV